MGNGARTESLRSGAERGYEDAVSGSTSDNEPALIFTTSEGQQIQGQLAEPAPSTLHGHELLVTVGQPQTGNDEPLREGKPVRQSARRKGAKAS